MEDKYGKFAHLTAAEKEGVDYRVLWDHRGSRRLVLAPHGGDIEPGTSEVAKAVAGEDLSFYLFEGNKPRGNRALHITSTSFDEPRAMELLKVHDKAITVHGEGSREVIVFIGGRDEELRPPVERCLQEAGFDVRTHTRPVLQGISPDNICNRCRTGAGLQLELSRGLRERCFRNLARDDRRDTTKVFDDLVRAIRAGIGCTNTFPSVRRGADQGVVQGGIHADEGDQEQRGVAFAPRTRSRGKRLA